MLKLLEIDGIGCRWSSDKMASPSPTRERGEVVQIRAKL